MRPTVGEKILNRIFGFFPPQLSEENGIFRSAFSSQKEGGPGKRLLGRRKRGENVCILLYCLSQKREPLLPALPYPGLPLSLLARPGAAGRGRGAAFPGAFPPNGGKGRGVEKAPLIRATLFPPNANATPTRSRPTLSLRPFSSLLSLFAAPFLPRVCLIKVGRGGEEKGEMAAENPIKAMWVRSLPSVSSSYLL